MSMKSAAARRLDHEDDPVLAAFLSAPADDRAETDEERAAVEAAKAEARASGRMIPHAEIMAAVEAAKVEARASGRMIPHAEIR